MELCTRANIAVALFDPLYPTKDSPSDEVRFQRNAAAAVCYAVIPGELWGAIGYFWELDPSEKQPHSVIIRDVFGNPFHSPQIMPCWKAAEIITLARTIYNEKIFGRLPELGEVWRPWVAVRPRYLSMLLGPSYTSSGAGCSTYCWERSEPWPEPEALLQ